MKFELRPYQKECVNAIYDHLRTQKNNPCAVLPTAAGKTPVLAQICQDTAIKWKGRALILTHVKELLTQAVEKLDMICPEIDVGIYSAGLGRRDTQQSIIAAGIQSVFKRACDLDKFNLIIVDEAHLIPESGDGMYQKFFADARIINPKVRIIGLTATPFRMKGGLICKDDNILNEVCFEVGVKELIKDGYLCPLVAKERSGDTDFDKLHVRMGEFIEKEATALMENTVEAACSDILERSKNRRSVIIFSCSVSHGMHIQNIFKDKYNIETQTIFGSTPSLFREQILQDFKDGKIKYLINVNVLTTGFDAPNIDTVALVRPTLSPGLYYQMVGRGFRLHPAKTECLILDYGGNVLRHGPVDAINGEKKKGPKGEAPTKVCPECSSVIFAGLGKCPDCGYVFPPNEKEEDPNHDRKAGDAAIISGEVTLRTLDVLSTEYFLHQKKGAKEGTPRTLRVEYQTGWNRYEKEWVCLEHKGFAGSKAASWWRKRTNEILPLDIEEAVLVAPEVLAKTEKIILKDVSGQQFSEIVGYELGPVAETIDYKLPERQIQ